MKDQHKAIIVGLLLFIFVFLIFKAGAWSATHKVSFRSPFQNPVVVREKYKISVTPTPKVKVSPTPVKGASLPMSEKDIVMRLPHGKVLWGIYMLESSQGKADWCRQNGRGVGGFGVMGDQGVACYSSFSEAAQRASYWFEKLNPEKNLASALCQYNLGIANLPTCNYYQNYLSLQ